MSFWFLVCAVGLVGVVPIHFLSVERLRLRRSIGSRRGALVGDALGLVSGWGFFLFLAGLWFSPQPRFTIPFPRSSTIALPYVGLELSLLHAVVSAPFLAAGSWLGIGGVAEVSLRVAEIHRAERVITTGVYSFVRHPQYLGGMLAHIGFSVLLAAWYSLLLTPVVVALNYLISWKEEEELVKQFGEQYEGYREKVPMFIPRLRGV